MYLRLQARYNSKVTGKPCGLFAVVHHLKDKGVLSDDEQALLFEIKVWFVENLPTPPFYDNGNADGAITWFKASSKECMIERLLPLKEIAERHCVTIDLVESDSPGQIVYEDQYQIGVV